MNKVYFLKNSSRLSEVLPKVLNNFYTYQSQITVKIHFGEIGNKTALSPLDIQPLSTFFKQQGNKLSFFDTCVMYPSPRNRPLTHKILAQSKGWGKLGAIKIGQKFKGFKAKDLNIEVPKDLIAAESVLVISHVKGHPLAGFGGAIKNLGMGGVSPQTKKELHSLGKPYLASQCQGCGFCVKVCPFKAITLVNHQPKIKNSSCFGCSLCVIKCPYHCLKTQKALFDNLLAQAAATVAKNLPKKTFYINFLKRVTRFCDCFNNTGKIITPDIGVLFATDPALIDQASLDLINQRSNNNLFEKINHKDPYLQVKYAASYLKSSLHYQLEEI